MRIDVLIPSAGIGKRFSNSVKKQFFKMKDKPILYYTLDKLKRTHDFNHFIIGVLKEDFELAEQSAYLANLKSFELVEGCEKRQDTVYSCLSKSRSDFVMVHDAVRPFVSQDVIRKTIDLGLQTGAAICVLPVKDTLKLVKGDKICSTVDRNKYVLTHTPQVFKTIILTKALEYVRTKNINITDDAQAVEIIDVDINYTLSNYENIKITFLEDLRLAEYLIDKI